MSTLDQPIWVDLKALACNPILDVPLEIVVETVWAITHFVYTNDHEVDFVRLLPWTPKPGGEHTRSILRRFIVHETSRPADIAKVDGSAIKDNLPQLDPSAPLFTQIARKIALLFTYDDDQVWEYGPLGQDTSSLIFKVSFKDRLRGVLLPNALYHGDSLEFIADTIRSVTEEVAKNWTSSLSDMNFLGPKNWSCLAKNAPETAVIGPSVVCDILTRWSLETPDKVAIEAWDGVLTYFELYQLARGLAAQLLRTGIVPEERVGICMKKSRWAIVSFWGLLFAGVTGVPLDIRNPQKRMKMLLSRVEARYVIVDEWTSSSFDGLDISLLRCETMVQEPTHESTLLAELPKITPKTVAFILFTSGSTGVPKGVIVEHGPLYGSTVEIAREFHLNHSSRTFQFSSFVFDGSMGDIFPTMYMGGCLYVPSEEERLDNLQGALEVSRATHACLTSTVMSQLLPERLSDLRYMIAVGEAISKENILRWSPYVHMISAYGIAESIIYDSFASPEHLASDYRNIGLSKGPCLWVTDIKNPERLMPVGAIGEILIEGPLLARGYMGDPKKTAERFVSAPTWLKTYRGPRQNHRCYRSGDYGIANGDGTVLYLGRADTQVKVRGQRVELGEIAHGLLDADPRLGQVAVEVLSLQSLGNSQRLVAFIERPFDASDDSDSPLVPLDEDSKTIFRNAQRKLLESLPRHMVPSMFIPAKYIPKNASGKRDRQMLLSWGASLSEEEVFEYQLRDASSYRASRTPRETLLQRLCAEILHVPETFLGADDDFFQAGGDSIKLINLLANLREHGYTLAVSQVFECPRLGQMAGLLQQIGDPATDEAPQPFEMVSTDCVARVIKEAARVCAVSENAIDDIYPATPLQEALMAISTQQAEIYTHRLVFKIPASVDIDRFKKAWEALAVEQTILRTCIAILPDIGAAQVIIRAEINWHSDMTLAEFFQNDKETSFAYGSVLNRVAIVKDEDDVTYFVWSGHHAISDGWSRPAMFDELYHIYLCSKARPQAPFTLFVKHIIGLNFEESDEFWRDQFPDVVEAFPKLPKLDYTPQPEHIQSLSVKLEHQKSSSITTATLLQAAWGFVTATYANADEAVFGLTLSGRDAPVAGITKTLGVTITTVPVRIVLDSTSTIFEYLQDVQQYLSDIKDHQHVGLERISRLSPEARSATRFQSLLVIQAADEERDHDAMLDLGFELVQREENDMNQYALTVQCTVSEQGTLQIKAHFDDKVIDAKLMDCFLHLFVHIVKQLTRESRETSLHDLDRMSPHDLGLLAKYNSDMPSAIEQTLHGLFEERARDSPDATALDGFDGQLTYSELDNISSRLARHLHYNAGVDIESHVMLCFAKSNMPIIAMLATLKSGGVCVSINPEHPTFRLIDLIKDAKANVVLCDESDVNRFREHAKHVIGVTKSLLIELNSKDVSHQPLPAAGPRNGSFVVFTSGSTGKPKGSLLEHRSIATDLMAVGQRVGLDARVRTLQFSSYTFDAHILEIMGTLIQGGCVCVISDHERMNCLSEVINERRVSFALLTKTVSRLLEPSKLSTLKTLILSGESNSRQDYWRWSDYVRLYNGLGPSECTPLVCLTRDPVLKDDDPTNIGHSLACHIWIADHRRRDRLVPIGCVGELTVEGPIVGRGYLARPKETAFSFFEDPTWSKSSTSESRRFYRSGDLARMNADGSITFIGRADNQVKIHGQRVELGEIEDQLRRCGEVFNASAVDALNISSRGDATVLAVFCSRGNIFKDGESPILSLDDNIKSDFRAAQAHLTKILPQYMVPSLFFPVSHLPFNASGKLERKSLRDWVTALDTSKLGQYYLADRKDSTAPSSVAEKCLQALWSGVLDIPLNTIYVEDSFFRLGGDSVLSMRLIADARAQGISMTVAEVFRKPTLKDMAQVVADSMNEQTRVTAVQTPYEPFSLIKNKTSVDTCVREAAQDCDVLANEVEDIYPCDPTQEALMAATSHRPKAYTYQIILKLPDKMEVESFKVAWANLVATQAILRTRIVFRRGLGSLQVVLRPRIDWHTVSGISLEEYLELEGDLTVEYGSPLSKFALLKHQDQTTFVGTLHHSLYDGWSMMRTWEMFSEIYTTGSPQREVVPYSNFSRYLSSVDENELDTFWKDQFPTIIESYPRLPSTDFVPRPQKSRTSTIQLSRKAGSEITLATVVQTAWAILMSKYSDSEDVVFGLMLSGRDAPIDGITEIIGPTIATVPLRIHVDKEKTLLQLLEAIQTKTTDIRKYQHAGLRRIRRLSREAAAAAEFQNLLVVHTMGEAEITSSLSDLGLQPERNTYEEFLDLALTAECTVRPDSLQLLINYDSSIVCDRQVDFMLHQLGHLASLLIEDSASMKLRDAAIASPYDLQHLSSWNENIAKPTETTVHGLFEAQVRLTPDAIAISGYDGEYTYTELDSITDGLAAQLNMLGVGPEKHVALCFHKSSIPVIAILAVLKAGGVSTSINVQDPIDRRLDMCKDIDAIMVLCDPDLEMQFSGHVPYVLGVDAALLANTLQQQLPEEWTKSEVRPENAAFIVHTSGSTGKPKGCILEHGSLSLALKTFAVSFDVTSTTRMLQFSSYAFDAHILEIFGTLLRGGCVCIISEEERMNELVRIINMRKVTCTFQTPTVAQLIDPADVPTIDTIIMGAERLTQKVVDVWSSARHPVRVIQFYAPAESSNVATVNFELGLQRDPTNIGPAWNCGIWITERNNPDRLVPVGCIGEILIEGPTLGRGYWKRPEATEAAFIHDPAWSSKAGQRDRRFYRTGDMAYFQPDGSVKFIGRADTQVKIHGQRIELTEVEHQVIQGLPAGAEAAVEIIDHEGTTTTLTAFIKLPSFAVVETLGLEVKDPRELYNFRAAVRLLKATIPSKLPQYMIPSAFVPISNMPISASTKIERKRLREFARGLGVEGVFFNDDASTIKESPINSVESSLQLIWSQILNLSQEQIGTNEHFTSLGGDSITAMQVVSECRKAGIKLQVATILSKRTIQAIAPHCTVESTPKPVVVSPDLNGVLFELSPMQRFYFSQEEEQWTPFNQSYLCRLKTEASAADVRRAFGIIVERHAMLRARFRRADDDERWMQYTVSAIEKDVFRFKAHSLTRASIVGGGDLDAYVQRCAKNSLECIDIIDGPVFSIDFFDVSAEDSMLYMVAHHLVIDLVSWRVIWRDLEDILRKGNLPTDSPPPISFRNWLTIQKQAVDDASVAREAREYLSSIPATQYDYWSVSPSENTLENSVESSFTLSPEATSLILGKANNSLHTNVMDIALGMLLQSFARTFKDRNLPAVLVEHHGREFLDGLGGADLSETVGWFTSLCPLHVPLMASNNAIEAVTLTKDSRRSTPKNGQVYFAFRHLNHLDATFNQCEPFELLVNYSGIFQQLENEGSLMQLESRVGLSKVQESDPQCRRFALICLEIGVSHGIMQFSLDIHKNMAHQDRIKQWMTDFERSLGVVLPQLAALPQSYTLTDFPRLKFSYEELRHLLHDKLPQEGFRDQVDLIENISPCTVMQEGILLSQQTRSEVYQLQYIWEFKDNPLFGEDLVSRLAKAWKCLTQRHSSLRTAIIEYATDQSHFVQITLQKLHSSRFIVADRIVRDSTHIPDAPDPEHDMFWEHVPRLTVYHTAASSIACALKLSHALIDGTSIDLMMNELLELVLNNGISRTQPALDFGKYIEYEQSVKSSQDVQYWEDYLRDAQPCHIPCGKFAPDGNVEGDYEYTKLPINTTEGLAAFSQRLGVTQAVVIQAAWAIVLGAFTGESEVCFGYLASGRDAPLEGIQDSIGLYISMQVSRVRVVGSVKDLLQGVSDDVIAGLDHRHCSLAQIQSTFGTRGLSLFDTCITIRRFLGQEATTQMNSLITVMQGAEKTEFAIALDASVGPTDAEVGMSYQKSKIPPALASSIAGSLETVIRSMVRSEDTSVHSIDLIGKTDSRLVQSWYVPSEKIEVTLHGLVERQALATPNAVATSGFDGEYTYSELENMAERLAAHLQSRGVDMEARVVLCFPKSTWPVVSMLAVLKAGGVCVSTNPAHPIARLLEIVRDAEASVVLCDESNAGRFHGHVAQIITVNDRFISQLETPVTWEPPTVKPDNGAFIVYTSGSTGKPKGCLLEHHAVSKSQLINADAMSITPTTRVMQFAAYTFDASICEIFAPLVVGACLCVISDDERMDDLAGAINANKADWIMLTPTVAQLLNPTSVPTLKTLVFGGEPLSQKVLEVWQGHVHLVNYWGPTECANSGCLNRETGPGSNPMNIGRASGCNVWIALQNNPHKLAPIGCIGELIVESSMLGREYINRPEVTAAAFVTDLAWARTSESPSSSSSTSLSTSSPKLSVSSSSLSPRSSSPSSSSSSLFLPKRRFYRSGDLGHLNLDGTITIVGRADNQVKIHGQRVELDEIKHQIATRLPSGSELAIDICPVNSQSEKPVLVAFIKLNVFSPDEADLANLAVKPAQHQQRFQSVISELNQALPTALPHHMIPAAYIPVCRVPTTPSAKTDRGMLREYAASATREVGLLEDVDVSKKQPSTDVERDLQTVWAKVLNHPKPRIGVNDTFMSLGGDSITAMQAVAHCRKVGLKLSVSAILKQKTIFAIAPHCERIFTDSSLQNVHVGAAAAGVPFDLSPIQKRYFEQESSSRCGRIQYNQSLFVRLKQGVSEQSLQYAFDTIVSRHGMLRARFLKSHGHDGEWQQVIIPHSDDVYHFTHHELDEVDEEAIHRRAEGSSSALDIVDGPVFSVDIFNVANQDKIMFVAAHHLVIDIVSWQVILRELEGAINSRAQSEPPSLTFQQWIDLTKKEAHVADGILEEVLPLNVPPSNFDFWRIPAESNIFKDNFEVSFELSSVTTDLILTKSNEAMGTTPLEILLGPLLLSFRQNFTERDIPSVFIEHHGREAIHEDSIEPSQLVGWFTTMYPVHMPINVDTTTTESVRLVKDMRRKVPKNGFSYFLHRHLTAEGNQEFASHDPVELLINYSGAFQQFKSQDSAVQLESRVKSTVSDADPSAHRWAMIDVEVSGSHGVMKVSFLLNRKMAHLNRVKLWINHYEIMLSQTAESLASSPLIHTLSDFPLLEISQDELSAVLSKELPQLGFSDPLEIVESIMPTSSFQRLALEGHLDAHPRHWTFYYFELPHDVDTARLQHTCIKMVEHYSMLRTLFIKHGRDFLQIVLKSLQPQVLLVESTGDISTFMEGTFYRDLTALPSLGSSFLRFTIIRTPTQARLLMRLSHAQFDGFSRVNFVNTLAMLYSSQDLPSKSIDYSDFILRTKNTYQQGCKYWRAALAGAQPTTIFEITTQPRFKDEGVIRAEKTVPAFTNFEGVTSATLFNAACAILIHSLTGSSDITFCRLTSGRAALDSQFQDLVGPCLNIVPVRVRLRSSKMDVAQSADVLQQIHKQFTDSIPYENVGLDDIIRECTDWDTSMAKFPIVTQYLNLEQGSNVELTDGGRFEAHVWEPATANPFPWSLTLGAFPSKTGVKISISANSKYAEKALVGGVLDGLCEIIDRITA